MLAVTTLLKVLSDPTRLRLVALLASEELSVGELARAVAMTQSRVSNHLKLLRDARLLDERREGPSVLVRLARGEALPEELWSALEPRLATLEGRRNDLKRLERILEERRAKSRDFFDRAAAQWDRVASSFERGLVRWRAVSCLAPRGLVVADVGCGTGFMATALLSVARQVICIDHSRAMLDQAKQNLLSHVERVDFREGELDRLPLADGEVDAVFASMVLHHVPDVVAALREMRRALKPGGRLVITDLLPHKESWMSESMADLRLGLDPTDLVTSIEKAGFVAAGWETIDDTHVVTSPDGRRAALDLFLIQAETPQSTGDARR